MWDLLARFIVRKSVFILITILVGTAIVGYNSTEQRLQWSLPKMLPDNDSTLMAFNDFKDRFGNNGQALILALEENPLDDLELFNSWFRFGKQLESIDGVDTVVAINQLFNVVKDTANKRFELHKIVQHELTTRAELDSVRALVYALPFYKGRLMNDTNHVSLMLITLNQKIFNSKQREPLVATIFEVVNKYRDDNGLNIHYSGMPYIRTMITHLVKTELQQFLGYVILVMVVILLIFFRSFSPVLVSLLIVLLGVTWSFGIIAFFGYEITILTGIIPPLIIVIGIPNSIYLINRYHSEYALHGNKVLAISRVVRKIGQATLMTNVTTAVGFLAFVFTQSTILVEFGIVAFVNIMVLFILSIFMIPAILGVLPPPKERQMYHLDRKGLNKVVEGLIHVISFHRTKVYWVSFVLVLFCVYGLSLMTTTGNLTDDLPQDGSVVKDLQFVEDNFNGVMPFEIGIDALKPGMVSKGSTLKRMDKLHAIFDDYPEFGKPMSIIEGVKYTKQAFYGGDPEKYELIKGSEKVFIKKYLDNTEGNSGMLDSYVDSTGQYARVSIPMKDVGSIEMDSLVKELEPKIAKIFPADKFNVLLTGPGLVYLKGTKYLVKNLLQSLALAIVIIAMLMAALFKSYRMIIMSIAVNMIPLLVTGAMMGFFGIPLKPSTILVFSIAFGISIDDTIHFLAKYRQELENCEWDLKPAVVESIKETGVSMMYTSIILFFGFGVFASSDFGGTQALGILTSLTLLVAMVVNLVLLPSLLLTMGAQLTNKAFKEPLIEIIDEEEDIDYSGLRIRKSDDSDGKT
ncbi:MAG: putative RND superfamily exporter protein [Salibacteraceae bacterium]|jgi:predicted RND superfamily exporter protein